MDLIQSIMTSLESFLRLSFYAYSLICLGWFFNFIQICMIPWTTLSLNLLYDVHTTAIKTIYSLAQGLSKSTWLYSRDSVLAHDVEVDSDPALLITITKANCDLYTIQATDDSNKFKRLLYTTFTSLYTLHQTLKLLSFLFQTDSVHKNIKLEKAINQIKSAQKVKRVESVLPLGVKVRILEDIKSLSPSDFGIKKKVDPSIMKALDTILHYQSRGAYHVYFLILDNPLCLQRHAIQNLPTSKSALFHWFSRLTICPCH